MIKNEDCSLAKELYEAWLATYEVHGGMNDIEQSRIYERARAAYERAYDELGAGSTQNILLDARLEAERRDLA
jgi:hypothetical protein